MTTFLLLGIAALYTAVALPLTLRRVPPNKTYGIRTPSTYADESVWYDANAAGGRDMIVLAVVFAICGLTLPNTDWGIGMAVALLLVGTLAMAWIGTARARRMLAEREDEMFADGVEEFEDLDEERAARRRQRTR